MSVSLTPPDTDRCQAEVIRRNPFVMGGPVRTVKRCENKPTVIAREKHPGADGQIGAMSLCAECREVFLKQMGEGFANFDALGGGE